MSASPGFDWKRQRILIVDRDDQFRFFARSLFLHRRVAEVQSTGAATDLPRILAHYDITLAFIEMPEAEAPVLDMLRWLRHDKASPNPDLPVVLLVKSLDKAQLARASAFGIHGILQKPVSGEKMLKATIGVATSPRLFKSLGRPVHKPESASSPAAQVAAKPAPPEAVAKPETPAPPMAPRRRAAPVEPDVRIAARPQGKPAPVHAASSRAMGGEAVVEGEAASTSRGGDSHPIELAAAPAKAKVRDWAEDEPPGVGTAPVEALEAPPPAAAARKKKNKTSEIELPAESLPEKLKKDIDPDLDEILAAHAQWVESSGRDGRRAMLEGREMAGLSLAGKVLSSAMLRRADLSGSDFAGADMHGIDLRNADLFGCSFTGANLAVARMRHAKLRGSGFAGACLKGADLGGADLSGASFGDADMTGAILVGAYLAEADLSQVSGLTPGQLEGVGGDAATRLPPGLSLRLEDEGSDKEMGDGIGL